MLAAADGGWRIFIMLEISNKPDTRRLHGVKILLVFKGRGIQTPHGQPRRFGSDRPSPPPRCSGLLNHAAFFSQPEGIFRSPSERSVRTRASEPWQQSRTTERGYTRALGDPARIAL